MTAWAGSVLEGLVKCVANAFRVTFWRTCGNESWDFGPKSVDSDLTAVKWQTINDARASRRRVSVTRRLTFRGAGPRLSPDDRTHRATTPLAVL